MRRLLSVLVLLCSTPCRAALGAQAPSPFDSLKARALLERSLPCLGCHALGAIGGRVGPDLATVRERRTAQYITAMIDDPQRLVPGSAMPRTLLPLSTRALLIRYLARIPVAPAPRPVALPPTASTAQGPALYARWCAPCHGLQGGGDGPNAKFLPVRPAAHRDGRVFSTRSDDQLFDAIAAGGAAMGRSARMPAFGATLTTPELRALVAQIRAFCQCRAPAWSTVPNDTPTSR